MANAGGVKPRLLDLFCGAGGASMGYYRAGFEVEGVDIKPQPHYPFRFHQADALTFPLKGYDAYHASPPCQFGSVMRLGRWQDREHLNLIPTIRKRLKATGMLFVIENVEGSRRHLITPVKLCATMLGLGTAFGNQLRRHRYFECEHFWLLVPPCNHNKASVIGVYGGGQHPLRRRPVTVGVYGHVGGSSNRDGLVQFGTDARREAMGIDWMTGNELSEAIPPAYTEYIGKHLMKAIQQNGESKL